VDGLPHAAHNGTYRTFNRNVPDPLLSTLLLAGLDESGSVAGADESVVHVLDVVRDGLGDGVAAVGVGGDALGVADEHADDPVDVADRGDVVVDGEFVGGASDRDLGPELLVVAYARRCW
jgi:hypothetical protein